MIRRHLPLEHIFGFCKSFKKTKGLGFELELRTSKKKRKFLYTLLGNDAVNVTISTLKPYKPTIIPRPGTQIMFKEAITKSFTLSFESCTDRKPVDTGIELQLFIGSADNINAPLYF